MCRLVFCFLLDTSTVVAFGSRFCFVHSGSICFPWFGSKTDGHTHTDRFLIAARVFCCRVCKFLLAGRGSHAIEKEHKRQIESSWLSESSTVSSWAWDRPGLGGESVFFVTPSTTAHGSPVQVVQSLAPADRTSRAGGDPAGPAFDHREP